MTADLINGLFEFAGGWFVLLSVWKLWKDKKVAGISWVHVAFFSVWGFWNLVYYPALEQWWSFAGGLWIVLVNTIYVGMLLVYGGQRSYVPQRRSDPGGIGPF